MVQKTVSRFLSGGFVGSIAYKSPHRVNAMPVQSGDDLNNVAGRAFTYSVDQKSVQVGGTGVFAGVFINPQELPGYGIFFTPSGDPFVVNGTVIELITMGEIWVSIDKPNTLIGSLIGYDTTTGELKVVADATALPTGVQLIPNCAVTREQSSSETPSLATIKLTN